MHVKTKLPQYRRKKLFFGGMLAKFMFIRRCQNLNADPTLEFFKAAGHLYNPVKKEVSEDLEENETSEPIEEDDVDFDPVIDGF